ncbi:MAG TPA: hypothetical protein VFO52_06175 [Longimicrobiales bacterium]|nr:hypothetical protein [Longimicrobiales bacterium]
MSSSTASATAHAVPASPITAARATPFWLPAAHFVTGLVFLTAVALLLPFVAPDLAAGRFLQPRVVAATHLITLGWLTVSIMGALCQLFTVVLGTPLRWIRVSAVTLALYAPGLALFVTALLAGWTTLVIAGALMFSSALILFLVNAIATLKRSKTRDLTWWSLAGAFFFLAATITFGVSLAVNLQTSHLGYGRLGALFVHVHVALGGWVLLTVIGVARRLLPMFLLSHGADERALRVAAWSMGGGAFVLTLFHRALTRPLALLAIALMALAVIALAAQIAAYVRTRHRPQLDAGLRMVLAGGAFLLAGLVIGLTALLRGGTGMLAAYGVAIVGGLGLFVAGHYYKILPFLLWNHRFAPLVGKRTLPKISDLYDAGLATVASCASIAGMLLLLLGTLLHVAAIAIGAAVLLACGFVIEAGQLFKLLRTKVA